MNRDFSFVKESANNQDASETLRVLTYEVGDMNKVMHYRTRYSQEKMGYIGELRKATSQAISMLRMFCEQQKWDFEELADFGEKDYLDKMQDLRKHGLQERLKQRDAKGE
jgi:hypothetical protein